MAIVLFPLIPGPAYIRTFPRPSAYRRFPVSGPSMAVLSIAYTTTTLTTLLARLRERLLVTFWTDAELTAYLNEALRIWNTLTGYWRLSYSQVVGAGVTFVDLNDNLPDYQALLRVEVADSHLELTSLAEMDEVDPGWQATTAAAIRTAAPIAMDRVAFSPPPSADTNVTFYYIRTAPILSAASDTIQMGEEDLKAIIDYANFVANFKEGTSEMETAIPKMQNFMAQAAKYNSRLTNLSIFRRMLGLAGQKVTRPLGQERLAPRGGQ